MSRRQLIALVIGIAVLVTGIALALVFGGGDDDAKSPTKGDVTSNEETVTDDATPDGEEPGADAGTDASGDDTGGDDAPADDPTQPPADPGPQPATFVWMDEKVTDVVTGETFTIADYKGKPVLVESFAVWCSTCVKQLQEMKKLLDAEGDDVILIAVDADPNEDAAKVKAHVQRYGFKGRFVIAPENMTAQLVNQFGPDFISPPSAPVVLVSADHSQAVLLDRGVKSAADLKKSIDQVR